MVKTKAQYNIEAEQRQTLRCRLLRWQWAGDPAVAARLLQDMAQEMVDNQGAPEHPLRLAVGLRDGFVWREIRH